MQPINIKKILIANRGEIAIRIIRTCREMGIKTVVLCPLPGQEPNFLETNLADEYYFLGEEGAIGYLNKKKIIEIGKKAKVDAVHPGYGFLAENWQFAKLCERNRIRFIGPHFKVLKRLEDKLEAKKIAQRVGIPTLPASDGPIKTKKDLVKWVQKIKPPFVLKALKGGGGIGIRIVNGELSFGELFALSLGIQRQMATAFSEFDFFLEKYLTDAKHIEFQILGDGQKIIHLGERECTIQRRFQKLIEESPSTFLDEKKREEMGALAIKLAKELKYRGAATIEFLMDREKNFYFMEVNPRLQVEHPVTEAITGIDIVEQQIKVSQGENLSLSQDDIYFNGWAIETRINAEDPQRNFQPSPGKIEKYFPPGGQGIFLHTFLKEGQEIYPYFDSLLAKIIAWGKDRKEAVSKLKRALNEIIIEGVPTTIPLFKIILEDKDFLSGNFTNAFLEKSGILQKILPQKFVRRISKISEMEEKDIAEIIFQIYQSMKKSPKDAVRKLFSNGAAGQAGEISDEGEKPSNWVLAERLKMFE